MCIRFNPLEVGSYCYYTKQMAMTQFLEKVSIPQKSGHIVIEAKFNIFYDASFNPLEVGSYCYQRLRGSYRSGLAFQSPRSRVILLYAQTTARRRAQGFNPLEVGSYCYKSSLLNESTVVCFNPLEVGSYCYHKLLGCAPICVRFNPLEVGSYCYQSSCSGRRNLPSFNPLEVGSYCYFGTIAIWYDSLYGFNPLEVGSYCYTPYLCHLIDIQRVFLF